MQISSCKTKRTLRVLVIGLLLATLPCTGLATFAPGASAPCMGSDQNGTRQAQTDCCKALSDQRANPCKMGTHCAPCADLPSQLAITVAPLDIVALRAHTTALSTTSLVSSIRSDCWRPPRAV